jgi:hypothetical protein
MSNLEEILSNYNIEGKRYQDFLNDIQQIAKQIHNPELIDTKLSPNENTIYILWNDGEITEEKGSWSFGMRNVFTNTSSFVFNPIFKFPFSRSYLYNGIILKYDDCILFRNFLIKHLNNYKIKLYL